MCRHSVGRILDHMILAPRQLRRSGMTGNVPYYGGRFTPAQAYAASHPAPAPEPPQVQALRYLLDTGAITPEEFQTFRARVTG